ncbi:GIY-YIG nuclease family protein [Leptolyngbya sp. GB1-A1]|uniref:GIY-YIG nuclease family protein n=1 Tax=Leptolyngbya sp. GB1-A1 TaxID=2933908 RepID=UPI00329A1C3A
MTPPLQPQLEWQQWSKVSLSGRSNLPDLPGIYAVIDAAGEVWYVGKASNLRTRWGGRSHHRYSQLSRQNKKRNYQIYYRPCSLGELDSQEKQYIDQFKPLLNYSRVRTYARKPPQPHQELGRILRVINKSSFLFEGHARSTCRCATRRSAVRSLMVGYYQELDEDENEELKEFTCIVTATSTNDYDKVLYKSAMKSRTNKGKYLADCWGVYETTLGLNEPEIDPETRPLQFLIFQQNDWAYEFVPMDYPVLEQFDRQNQELYTETILLNGQSVLALKDPACLQTFLSPPESVRSGYLNKAWLRPMHYYHYRLPHLKPISELVQEQDTMPRA